MDFVIYGHAPCVGLARTVYIYTVYDRIFGDFPAKNTAYTPYIYCPCQPKSSIPLQHPTHLLSPSMPAHTSTLLTTVCTSWLAFTGPPLRFPLMPVIMMVLVLVLPVLMLLVVLVPVLVHLLVLVFSLLLVQMLLLLLLLLLPE